MQQNDRLADGWRGLEAPGVCQPLSEVPRQVAVGRRDVPVEGVDAVLLGELIKA